MKKLNLPHQEPILFAKEIESLENNIAIVNIEFTQVPTLAMLVEASAQSSAAFGNEDIKMGFLVTLKNIKLLNKAKSLRYRVKITLEHHVETLTYFKFEVIDNDETISTGVFVIAI